MPFTINPFTIDIADTVALATQVAAAGTIGGVDSGDQLFELVIAVAILIVEAMPN